MTIDKLSEDLNIIAGLGTNPNTDNNLTAEELKAMFDKASLILQAYINGTLVPAVNENTNAVSGKMDASGGKMTGNLNMDGNKVTGLPDPEEDSDAVNKAYMLARILDITGFSGEHKDLAGRDTDDQHPMSAITGLIKALGDKAAYVHDHDGRYYTETEINGLLSSSDTLKKLLASGPMVLSANQFGDKLPAAGTPGRIFFLKAKKVT